MTCRSNDEIAGQTSLFDNGILKDGDTIILGSTTGSKDRLGRRLTFQEAATGYIGKTVWLQIGYGDGAYFEAIKLINVVCGMCIYYSYGKPMHCDVLICGDRAGRTLELEAWVRPILYEVL